MRRAFKNKKGFSLTEIAVALSMITVVSVCAITIIVYSVSSSKRSADISEAQMFAADLRECFIVSDSDDEFIRAVKFAKGIELRRLDDGSYLYTSDKHGYEAAVVLNFSSDRRVTSSFSIKMVDDEQRELISFSYEKGGGV